MQSQNRVKILENQIDFDLLFRLYQSVGLCLRIVAFNRDYWQKSALYPYRCTNLPDSTVHFYASHGKSKAKPSGEFSARRKNFVHTRYQSNMVMRRGNGITQINAFPTGGRLFVPLLTGIGRPSSAGEGKSCS